MSWASSWPAGPSLAQGLLRVRGGAIFEEPIEAVSHGATSEREQALLDAAIRTAQAKDLPELAEFLDKFLSENPGSAWAPSCACAHFAQHYLDEGEYSKALAGWERVWEATHQYPDGLEKRAADYALANWTRLLAELGRVEDLEVIFAETEGRQLDAEPLQQKFLRTREVYRLLRQKPTASYRCGWLVLNELMLKVRGQGLKPRSADQNYQESSLFQSCSFSALVGVSRS